MKRRSGRGVAALVVAALGSGCQLIVGLQPVELLDADGGVCAMNGARDGKETDVDCGGSGCPPCAPGKGCQVGPDCESGVCAGGSCAAPECTDQKKNGDETDVDCGGSCPGCGAGKACNAGSDCKSAECMGGVCQATCADGEKDGSETGVDCGGGGCPACKDGEGCAASGDCESGVCSGGMCVANYVWSHTFSCVGAMDAVSPTGLALDKNGDVLLTGLLLGGADFGGGQITSAGSADVFLARFTSGGSHLWSQRFGDSGPQIGRAIAADSSGNVLVVGNFKGVLSFGGNNLISAGGPIMGDIFVAKLSSLGVPVWSKSFGDASDQVPHAVAVDSFDDVLVTGLFSGSVDFGAGALTDAGGGNIFVAKFDKAGSCLWSKGFGGLGAQVGQSVATDAGGNVVLTGFFADFVDFGNGAFTNAGDTDVYIAKFDKAGNHLWSKAFGDASDQSVARVAVDGAGNIFIAGVFKGTIDFGDGPHTSAGGDDLFLAKFSPAGGILWSKQFGDSSDQQTAQVSADAAGNVFLLSQCQGTVDFGGGPLVSAGGPVGGDDIFLAKFDSSGNHLWSRRFGDTHVQSAAGVAGGGMGDVVIAGTFDGTLDLGGGPKTSTGTSDSFLAKFLTP